MGLRPLAVHFDNGWNSELAVSNIEKIVSKLDIDLITYVIKWEGFKRLQIAYLKASVVDIEALTDHAIYKIAHENNIKYIISGENVFSEGGGMPSDWMHKKLDAMNIKSIFKDHGKGCIDSYPFVDKKTFNIISKSNVKVISLLNMIVFDVNEEKIKWKKSWLGKVMRDNTLNQFSLVFIKVTFYLENLGLINERRIYQV